MVPQRIWLLAYRSWRENSHGAKYDDLIVDDTRGFFLSQQDAYTCADGLNRWTKQQYADKCAVQAHEYEAKLAVYLAELEEYSASETVQEINRVFGWQHTSPIPVGAPAPPKPPVSQPFEDWLKWDSSAPSLYEVVEVHLGPTPE